MTVPTKLGASSDFISLFVFEHGYGRGFRPFPNHLEEFSGAPITFIFLVHMQTYLDPSTFCFSKPVSCSLSVATLSYFVPE